MKIKRNDLPPRTETTAGFSGERKLVMFNQKTIEMNYTEAKKYLARAEKNGYVAYYSGIVSEEVKSRWGENTTGYDYGINIDGDGHDGRYFGCPRIIWDAETAEEMFPTRNYSQKS